jgi:hypothetical protein
MSLDPVAVPSIEYEGMAVHWSVTASLRGGTPAMRAAGQLFLPKEPAESEEAYKNRIDRSTLTNMYVKTANKLVGKPLKKPIVLEESVPGEIIALMDDIDALGTSLDVFTRQVFTAAVDDGLSHILVDMPSALNKGVEGAFPDGSMTIEQERILNIRPFARHIKAADLIGWKWQMVDGRKTLTQIRIREKAKVEDGPYSQAVKNRIRVIEPLRWMLFEEQEKDNTKQKEWVLIGGGPNSLGKIGLITFYTNQKGFMIAQPLMLDVAHLNVAHWQSDSDQRNLLHIARAPILFATGFGDEDDQVQLEIGANTITRAPTGARLEFVEHSGAAIQAGAQDLKDLEERIQFLGMQFLIKRPSGDNTATGRAIDKGESDSDLGIITQELENALEQMLDLFAEWMNLGDSGGQVSVFRDFEIAFADAEDIKILLDARKTGEISRITFFKELKRRGLLSDDFNPQTEIDLLDIESGGSAGDASDEPDAETGLPVDKGEGQEGRNVEGDTTGESDGHRHILEANGKTDTVTDSETGESHFHTWDEFALRTSVEDGHSHILLSRAGGSSGKSSEGIEQESGEAAGAGNEIDRQGEGSAQPFPG